MAKPAKPKAIGNILNREAWMEMMDEKTATEVALSLYDQADRYLMVRIELINLRTRTTDRLPVPHDIVQFCDQRRKELCVLADAISAKDPKETPSV
jgi:hypothetical protein